MTFNLKKNYKKLQSTSITNQHHWQLNDIASSSFIMQILQINVIN